MKEKLLQSPDALLVLLLFCVASLILDRVLRKISAHFDTRASEMFRLLGNSQRAILLTIGVIMAIGELGFDISALVAGLGLTGFALGFAMKDAISNLIAGVMIVVYKPCEIGDRIEILGVKGTISDVNLRYITVADKIDKWLIPNSKIINSELKIVGDAPRGGESESAPEKPAASSRPTRKKAAPKRRTRGGHKTLKS